MIAAQSALAGVLAVISSRIAAAPVDGDRPQWWWVVAACAALAVEWLGWVRGDDSARVSRYTAAMRRVNFS